MLITIKGTCIENTPSGCSYFELSSCNTLNRPAVDPTLSNGFAKVSRLHAGDAIQVRIDNVDVGRRKLKLSMKGQDSKRLQTEATHNWYNGVVSEKNAGGALVSFILEDGDYKTGFLPRTQIPSRSLPAPLAVGQAVKVRVLSFNFRGGISLSMMDISSPLSPT